MNPFIKLENWGERHHPKILDIIRILLGILLVAKAYTYFVNGPYLRDLILQNRIFDQSPDLISAIIFYTTYVQIVCGALIFLGLRTRIASIVMLPLMIGAVFFINIYSPFYNNELWLSILVLVLLFLFIVIGSGPISLDRLLTFS
jgi:putative oxidoreductase